MLVRSYSGHARICVFLCGWHVEISLEVWESEHTTWTPEPLYWKFAGAGVDAQIELFAFMFRWLATFSDFVYLLWIGLLGSERIPKNTRMALTDWGSGMCRKEVNTLANGCAEIGTSQWCWAAKPYSNPGGKKNLAPQLKNTNEQTNANEQMQMQMNKQTANKCKWTNKGNHRRGFKGGPEYQFQNIMEKTWTFMFSDTSKCRWE